MCDYSLHNVANRPARIEDKLVATKFPNSITRGFAAAGEPHVAVCLLPGTEIAFDQNVECEPSFGIGSGPVNINSRVASGPTQLSQLLHQRRNPSLRRDKSGTKRPRTARQPIPR